MYHSFLIHSSPALEIYHRDRGKGWGSKTETERRPSNNVISDIAVQRLVSARCCMEALDNKPGLRIVLFMQVCWFFKLSFRAIS